MAGLMVNDAQVFGVRPGMIGKQKNISVLYVDLVVPLLGNVNCVVEQNGLTFMPQVDQKISAQVGRMRAFASGVSLSLVPGSLVVANGGKPVPPSGR